MKLDSFDTRTVRRMLEFMYTSTYGEDVERHKLGPKGRDCGDAAVHGKKDPYIKKCFSFPSLLSFLFLEFTKADKAISEKGTQTHDIPYRKAGEAALESILSISPQITETQKAVNDNNLLLHIRMNAIGDYLDIPTLRNFANVRIAEILDSNWSADAFIEGVKETFDRNGDEVLHNIMKHAATKHIDELINCDEFMTSDMMSEFGADILRNVVRRNQELSVRGQKSDEALAEERRNHEMEKARHRRIEENIDNVIETLAKTVTCRRMSCEHPFNCYIQRSGTVEEPQFTLGCSKCLCKHV